MFLTLKDTPLTLESIVEIIVLIFFVKVAVFYHFYYYVKKFV